MNLKIRPEVHTQLIRMAASKGVDKSVIGTAAIQLLARVMAAGGEKIYVRGPDGRTPVALEVLF